ncbi:MAG: hypothetical protein AB1776_07385 [Bacillota bacterium]
MSQLQRVFEVLERAGFEILPVPGLCWLELRRPEASPVFIKETILRELVLALGEDPELVARCLTDPLMVRMWKEEAKTVDA